MTDSSRRSTRWTPQSPGHLLLVLSLSIFIAEAAVMLLLDYLGTLLPMSVWVRNLLDSTLLVIMLFPGMYFFMFKPLVRHASELASTQVALSEERIRAQTEEALRLSEERYHSLFENMHEGFAYCRLIYKDGRPHDFTYLDVNAAFEQITGLRDIVGKQVSDAIPGIRESNPEIFEIYGRVASTGRSEHFETYVEGLQAWLAIAVYSSEPERFIAVFDNITERRQHERELEVAAAVSEALRGASSRAQLVSTTLDEVVRELKPDGATIALRDPATGDTVTEGATGEWAALARWRLAPGEGIAGDVISTGELYFENGVTASADATLPALHSDTYAIACVPLCAGEDAFGALCIGRTTGFSPEEVRLLDIMCEIGANAIHRATLHEQMEQHLHRLAALHTVDTALSASHDLHVSLSVLLEQVATQLCVDAACVLRLNPVTHALQYAAGHGFRTRRIEHVNTRLGECSAGLAALERRTVVVPDLSEAPGSLCAELLAGEEFVALYAVPLIAKGEVVGVLEVLHRSPLEPDDDWRDFLETMAQQAAIAIEATSLFDGLQRSNAELIVAYDATIEGWSRALDLRDHETEGHSLRVTEAAVRLAKAMDFDEADLVHVRRGALLHDIGKMGVPDAILLKPGPLTDDERAIMQRHPQYAHDMLWPITYLKPAIDIPYCHHEKWDGTGYPQGLQGENIPLMARIFAVVDVWDALRSDRSYRDGWSEDAVSTHLREGSGTHFDPQVLETFLADVCPQGDCDAEAVVGGE